MYDTKAKQFYPEALEKCLCGLVINPDSLAITCPQCERFYHVACINEKTSCVECGLVLMSIQQISYFFVLFVDYLIELGSLAKRPGPTDNLENNNGSSNKKVNTSSGNALNGTKETSKGSKVNRLKPSEAFYKECEAKAQMIYDEYKIPSNALHDKEKSRNSFRSAFAVALLAGVEELKTSLNDKNKGFVTDKMKKLASMSKADRVRYCMNIAMNIESHIYFNYSNQPDALTPIYKTKANQIKHYLALESNSELRSAILHEIHKPEKVAIMKEKELVPKDVKKQREERSQVFLDMHKLKEVPLAPVVSTVRGVTLEKQEQIQVSSSLDDCVEERAEARPSHYDSKSVEYFRDQISQLSLKTFIPKAIEKYKRMLPTDDAGEYSKIIKEIANLS